MNDSAPRDSENPDRAADHTPGPDPNPVPDAFAHAATLDARSLRGLAHPLRIRVLNLLQQRGPATGKTVSEWLDVSSASASYHLRQLEAHGFIEEDPSLGSSRERWWRSRHRGFRFPEHLDTDEPELSTAVRMALAASWSEELAAAVNVWAAQPEGWREAQVMSGRRTELTLDELTAFRAEVRALFDRYARGTGAPGSRPVHIQFAAFPDPEDRGPDGEDAGKGGAEAGT
ncbi:winged helix-turn-helix domain-containing protein [Nocardiopsis alborubida]|uniref:Helix-turn-helix domain-containing protein n=1 Tax=Nocardiopsis alborubida TaxID=146802 RepID=A0A7X6MGA0_9ACTN|nr:helix-turn-helix domain-containing protein [Nocardiopsis alborubida]NKZ01044.1 helix-turn-helix domain-containing protein [Nocardiopsis alborubida]